RLQEQPFRFPLTPWQPHRKPRRSDLHARGALTMSFTALRRPGLGVLLILLGYTALLSFAGEAGDQKRAAPGEPPVDRVRKALEQSVTIDFAGQTLQDVVAYLRQKTKI